MGEVGVDAPISRLVGIGQCASGDVFLNTGMIEFGLDGAETGFDVPQAFPVGDLCECHAQELVSTREALHFVIVR